MDKQLTDGSFQVILDAREDITQTFEINLGGVREDVCKASSAAIPFLAKLREEVEKIVLPVGFDSQEIDAGLLDMAEWAKKQTGMVTDAMSKGNVAALDATPVIPHRRYLTTQIYACAVGILTSKRPLELDATLTKTTPSVKYSGKLANVASLIKETDILTGSQSWPTAFMEYMLFKKAAECSVNYAIVDGSLITQNLLTRKQGRNLFRQMLATNKRKKYVGIMKDITRSNSELRMYARILKPGEMYIQGSLYECMQDRLQDYIGETSKFLETVGRHILRGVFKPGVKAFGFECHKDDLEEVIALLWLEKDGQPGHEIPFLLNQVDEKLRGRYRPQEISNLIDASLTVNFDAELVFDEITERTFR